MIGGQELCQKGVTDGRTDRPTEIRVLRAAWSQLKYVYFVLFQACNELLTLSSSVCYSNVIYWLLFAQYVNCVSNFFVSANVYANLGL